MARLERQARQRWAKLNPEMARRAASPGSYQTVAHLVKPSDWTALRPVHRGMISHLISQARSGVIGVEPCFAPGTNRKTVQAFAGVSRALQFFRADAYWSNTSAGPHVEGAPMTLRWSVVPDGTALPTLAENEQPTPSILRARLTALYGSEANWRAVLRQVFARWSEVSGVRYIEEMNDDGVPINGSGSQANAGVAGVRGDVRISGHPIDGASGVLAYNYFPNAGDMVIDTDDMVANGFFTNTSADSLNLRNVVAHEHGHGLAFKHVCPVNQTKLMEPFVSRNFDGPQIDDIQNAQRGYGDPLEDNDSQAGGTDLGILGNGTTSRSTISIDGSGDEDFYRFSTSGSKFITASLRPIGGSYLEGDDNATACLSAPVATFAAGAQRDLRLAVLNNAGAVVAQVNATGLGGNESLPSTRLPAGSGPFSLRVSGDSIDKVQLYNFSFTLTDAPSGASFIADGGVVVRDTQGNGNSNGRPDPGESSVQLTLPIRNNGDANATNVRATLVSLSSGVTVGQNQATYGSVAVDGTASNATLPVISLASGFSCGSIVQLRLDVQSDQGNASIPFSIGTGTPVQSSFSYLGSSLAIPDGFDDETPGDEAVATISVSGAGSVSDLNVGLESLLHTYVGDLVVSLTSPAGTTVKLVDRVGSGANSGDNFTNTLLDDEATARIQNTTPAGAPFTGSFLPASALSAFDGQNANGTWTLRVQDFAGGDTGLLSAFSLRFTTLECGIPAPVSSSRSGALINEFRTSGPNGVADEFIEIYNTTNSALDLSGWSVVAGGVTASIPSGKVLAPYGRLLLTGSGYSLANYGGPGAAAGDVSYSGDIGAGATLLLRDATGATLDSVNSGLLTPPTSATSDYSYVRRMDGPGGAATLSSAFNTVDVNSTSGPGTSSGTTDNALRLGAPGPQNLSSPIVANQLITFVSAGPVVRTGSGDTGTLAFRNVITNRAGSGRTLTALRFRLTAVTSGTSPTGTADARLASSSAGGTVLPLIVETPPAQPLGGGLNTSGLISLSSLPGGGLAPGQSVTVEFFFNIFQRGSFRYLVNLEPATTVATAP